MPASCGARQAVTAVIMIPMTRKSRIPHPAIRPPSSGFFRPIFSPISMVIPMARELIRFVRVIMIWEPVETAETSAALANFPTIIRSTAPYMACRNRAKRTGPTNRRSGPAIAPLVKSICFFIIHSFFSFQKHSLLRLFLQSASYALNITV